MEVGSNGEPCRSRMRKRISPADRSASLSTSSNDCSPSVETRAANNTSVSLDDDRTSSTGMSLRHMISAPHDESLSEMMESATVDGVVIWHTLDRDPDASNAPLACPLGVSKSRHTERCDVGGDGVRKRSVFDQVSEHLA